jgi:vancomycin aglycone glucosyltransferase
MEDTVAGQFEAITAAARGCDILVAGMALQFALHSVAEQMGIPYVYAAWRPITLPSQHHAPPPLPSWAQPATDGTADNRTLWLQDAKRWNDLWAAAINSHRAAAGLAPVSDVRSHILTNRPWLAADPALDVAARARAVAASVRTDGAEIAARRLIGEVTQTALGN